MLVDNIFNALSLFLISHMDHHIPFPTSYKPMLSPGKRDIRSSDRNPYTLKERASMVLDGIKTVGKTLYGYATDTYLKCRGRKIENDGGTNSANRYLFNLRYNYDIKDHSHSNKRISSGINSCTVKMQACDDRVFCNVRESNASTKKACINSPPIVSYTSRETDTPFFKSQPPIEHNIKVPKKNITNEKKLLPIKNDFSRSLDRSAFENVILLFRWNYHISQLKKSHLHMRQRSKPHSLYQSRRYKNYWMVLLSNY